VPRGVNTCGLITTSNVLIDACYERERIILKKTGRGKEGICYHKETTDWKNGGNGRNAFPLVVIGYSISFVIRLHK
jgi:hypothetical protein